MVNNMTDTIRKYYYFSLVACATVAMVFIWPVVSFILFIIASLFCVRTYYKAKNKSIRSADMIKIILVITCMAIIVSVWPLLLFILAICGSFTVFRKLCILRKIS